MSRLEFAACRLAAHSVSQERTRVTAFCRPLATGPEAGAPACRPVDSAVAGLVQIAVGHMGSTT